MSGIGFLLQEKDTQSLMGDLKLSYSHDKNGNFFFKIREEIMEDTMRKIDFQIKKDQVSSFHDFLLKIVTRLTSPFPTNKELPPFSHQHLLNDVTLLHVIEPPYHPGWEVEKSEDGKKWFGCLVFLFYYNETTVYCLNIPPKEIDEFLFFLQKMVELMEK
jgi:hypothetical protein